MQFRKKNPHFLRVLLLGACMGMIVILPCSAQKIPFVNYTVQNGLPQNTVNDIVQDHNGYIWFATQVGAARYDGYEFEYFNTSRGLPDNFVNCLLVDRTGRVWMGTENGIGILDRGKVTTVTVLDGLIDRHVDMLAEDHSGNVWVSTVYGISVITADTIRSYSKENALPDHTILDLFIDSKNAVHVATAEGVTRFRNASHYEKLLEGEIIWDVLESASGEIWYASQENGVFVAGGDGIKNLDSGDGLMDNTILSLMQDRRGRIWCGGFNRGLFLYEDGFFRNRSLNSGSEPIIRKLFQDSKERIWIQTVDNGIWLMDGERIQHLTQVNNLVHDHVVKIFEDSFGSIWIATLGGASKYGRVVFEVYNMDLGLPDNYISSVFMDSGQRIWFGSYGHLMRKQGKDIQILGENTGFDIQSLPLSFAEDRSNHIYIGTDKGLFYHGGRSIRPVKPESGSLDDNINSMVYTARDQLWCGTDSGIVILDRTGIRDELDVGNGLVNYQVNDLATAGEMVYCATEGGISVFDQGANHRYSLTAEDGLVSNVCIDITAGPDNTLWVATNRGVSRINPEAAAEVLNYTMEEGLTSNTTYFVEFGDSVSLWIGTERGIDVLNTETGTVAFYGYEEGFRPLETNARAISRGTEGELWIGTIGGLVHYRPDYNRVNTVPPRLILHAPLVDGELFRQDSGMEQEAFGGQAQKPVFPYKKNSLVFNWTAIHTAIPSRNRFSYFLEGFDDGWSEPGAERSFSYRKLPSGDYRFRVRAFNLDGIPVEREAGFAFTIKPPFWKTPWFIAMEILLGLTLIYGLIKFRERRLVREKRILEEKVRERTREIEDQKVEIEAQRDEISEQKRFVEAQRDQIAVQNKEITDSIHYAKSIQQAVLPGKRALEQTLPQHFIFFRPRDIVSGDFFWVEEKEDRIIVCAADCTGHGVPGAFMSMLGLTFLNEIVNKDGILEAAEILNRLRTSIIHALSHKAESSGTRDGMDVALVVIDPGTGHLEYSGAYNPLLIMRNGDFIEIKADKMPIGRHVGEEKAFTGHKADLLENDMIYLFSDGFRDQFGGKNGGKYKARPFKRLLRRISSEPVEKQLQLLENEMDSWMGRHDQVDDVLVMGIRYSREKKDQMKHYTKN